MRGKERIEYFLNQLKDVDQLIREGQDVGALARDRIEKDLWESVDKELDRWHERNRKRTPGAEGRKNSAR